MEYALTHTNPPTIKDNADGSSTISVGFTTGVVGCPYNMVAGDNIEIVIANSGSKTKNQIETEMGAAINAFIADKYPTT
jgi:hypothetical protein